MLGVYLVLSHGWEQPVSAGRCWSSEKSKWVFPAPSFYPHIRGFLFCHCFLSKVAKRLSRLKHTGACCSAAKRCLESISCTEPACSGSANS